jgi:Lyzozyme M1 (1,4-beta-N-acetylmuramidase)
MNNFQFVFIKATEGANFVDSNYLKNYNGARSRGMKVGAYHFFRPQVPGTIQAEHFLENSIICPGDLLPVLDVETTDAVQADQLKQEIQAFIDIVVDSIGVNPIIYTYQNFFNDHLDVAHADENLWIARYNKRYNPELKEAAEWHFWQYGQHGKVPGINAYVDFNVFCCDSSEFQYFTVPPFTADSLATY